RLTSAECKSHKPCPTNSRCCCFLKIGVVELLHRMIQIFQCLSRVQIWLTPHALPEVIQSGFNNYLIRDKTFAVWHIQIRDSSVYYPQVHLWKLRRHLTFPGGTSRFSYRHTAKSQA